MIGPRALRMDELGDAPLRDLEAAFEAGTWLTSSIDDLPGTSGAALADRVMAALADEPSPAATGFLAPLRARGLLGGLGQSFRQAWAAVGTAGRPIPGRASALAYVLALAIAGLSVTGAATLGVGSALGLFGPAPTQSPAPIVSPAPTVAPPSIAPSPAPTVSPSPIVPSPTPTESVEPSDDHGGGGGPGPDATDDRGGNSGPGGGGNSGPGSSDDGGSSGGGSGSGTSGSGTSGSATSGRG